MLFLFSKKKTVDRKEKRKTCRFEAGQSYCTMFTSLAVRRAITVVAHTHERTIRTPLCSSLSITLSRPRPSSCYRLPSVPLSSRIDGGDLQFGAAECRSAARGGCRRGRRELPRACNSPWRGGEWDGGDDGRGRLHGRSLRSLNLCHSMSLSVSHASASLCKRTISIIS